MANTKITPHVLDSTLISGHSTVTAATNDFVLIQDVSDSNALKKALVSDLAQNEESPTFTGNVTVDGTLTIASTIIHAGDTDTKLDFNQANTMRLITGDNTAWICDASSMVINEDSIDFDFRVESNGSTNMLFVDGGNDEVVIQKASSGATATAGSVLIVEDDDNTELSILGGSSSVLAINFGHSGDADDAIISYNTTSGSENMAFTVNAAERMRIGSGGEVGIGTNNPQRLLHLYANSSGDTAVMRIQDNGSHVAGIELYSGHGNWGIYNSDTVGDALEFRDDSAGATRMLIDTAGAVLVGTSTRQLYDTSSESGLSLCDTNTYANCGAHLEIAADADKGWAPIYINKWDWHSGDDGRFIALYVNGSSTDYGGIDFDGTNFSVTNFSDYRQKENIVDYTGGLAKINALQVRSFNKKEGASKDITQQGFIAHELAEHIPNAVIGTKDATKIDEAGKTVPDYQQVTRETLVPYLVSAIQEQQEQIEELKVKVKILES